MGSTYLLSVYLVMIFFQTLYIFEEIRNEAYQEVGSLNTYLLAASSLLMLYFLPLLIIIVGLGWGVYVAFLPTLLAIGNGAVHILRLIKDKTLRSSAGIGIFIGLSMSLSGVAVFLGLLSNL